ncbi:TonB-dependent receptor [Sphingomonas sp. NFR15]|uniref:TonB-dependent receptor n=1 Tax=Sphingomonas sp. NFR15 TaxID=1566282 RepID=UPI00089094A6|nr:TonB-dependent receptor [Sphingomonas sp. NFR15]SDA31607.1 TonB-dependent receptor [Sphingomonas sp. NFR15]
MTMPFHSARRAHALRSAALPALAAALATTLLAPATARADAVAPPAADDAGADTSNDVVVSGQRLSTARALEDKRASDRVIDVISADDLGKLPDATVADSLARVPGVSTIVNQDTGEGEYVTVRGLSGTYNAVMINGVRVANTDPSTRDVSLTVLPPYGLASVTVTKTLTPDQDGDAIGGTIDFRTPTAFDFKNRTTFRLYGSGGFNDRAKSADLPAENYNFQGDFAHRFADDRFGVFASANYGVTHGDGQETENDGEWEPNQWRANSTEVIDQRNMHLPGIDLDFRRVKNTRYGGNVSLDWHGDTTRLYLRGQISRQEQRGSNDVTDYRSRTTARLTQVDKNDTSLVQPDRNVIGTVTIGGKTYSRYGYTTSQIVDADGDGIITGHDANSNQYWSLNGRSGIWNPQAFQFARNFGTINSNQTLATVSGGGHSDFERLHVDYQGSYSYGVRENPDSYSISYNCDKCAPALLSQGLDWVSADPRFPQASPTGAAANVQYDPTLLPFDGASHNRDKQTDNRINAKLDVRYDFDGWLEYLKAGAQFNRSHRVYDYTPLWSGDFTGTTLDGKSLAASGLIQRDVTDILHGEYYYGAIFDPAKVRAAIDAAQALGNNGLPSATDRLSSDNKNTEKVTAGYLLAHLRQGAVQATIGVRAEHRETKNVFWSDDGDNSGFDSTSNSYTVVLPSANLIWRPSDKQVYHFALWTGYSPPEYGYLSGGQSVARNAQNEIIAISRGNPDLKAARAVNLDVSAEYYPDRTSIVSIAGYYKSISNFIFTNGSQVNADTSVGTVEISQPQNGKDAIVYGFEAAIVKQFQGLPAPFDGFGFEGNVTIQHSEGDTGQAYRMGKKIPLINTPGVLYNASLTYQKYGFEAKLSYNYRGKYIESLRDNAVDKWVQHNRSVDLHMRYNINDRFAIDVDVSNLLDDWKYWTTKGDNPSYLKDYMEPGRNVIVRASARF